MPAPQSDEMHGEAMSESHESMSGSDTGDQPESGEEGPRVSLHRTTADPGMLCSDDEPEFQRDDTPADYLDVPEWNQYHLVKARFERLNFKVQCPLSFVRIDPVTKKLYHHTHQQFVFSYKGIQFCEKTKESGDTLVPSKQRFIDKWLSENDLNIRAVRAIVCDPVNDQQDVYNTWPGPDAAKLDPVPPESIQDLINPIVMHIHEVMANGNQVHTDWILDWMSNMIQRPEKPSHITMLLYGAEGCGKDIVFDFLRERVLGKFLSFHTEKTENSILGRFATGLVNKVLVHLVEPPFLHKYLNAIKNIVTASELIVEEKFKMETSVNNYSNIVLTSNKKDILDVTPSDRRFVLFQCNEKYLQIPNSVNDYFVPFAEYMKRSDVARAFYQFAMARDLSAYTYDFQPSRPITDFYRECQRGNISLLPRFASALVNDIQGQMAANPHLKKTPYMEKTKVFNMYVQFAREEREEEILKRSMFSIEFNNLPGVSDYHRKLDRCYKFDIETLYKHLSTKKMYDSDATTRMEDQGSEEIAKFV